MKFYIQHKDETRKVELQFPSWMSRPGDSRPHKKLGKKQSIDFAKLGIV